MSKFSHAAAADARAMTIPRGLISLIRVYTVAQYFFSHYLGSLQYLPSAGGTKLLRVFILLT